jgi:hypothetical protein
MWYHESDPTVIVAIHQRVAQVCTSLCKQGITVRFDIEEPRSISEPFIRITLRIGEHGAYHAVNQHMIRQYGSDLRWLDCSLQDMVTNIVRTMLCNLSSPSTKQK